MRPRWRWRQRRCRPPRASSSRLAAAALVAAAAGLLAAACAGAPERRAAPLPLFDADHPPEVLTESRRLEPPPSLAGNSFVAGWSPWRDGKALHLVVQGGSAACLNLVSLEPRPRLLTLVAPRLVQGAAQTEVEVRLDGEPAGRHAVAAGEIPLPAPSHPGRVAVEIFLPAGTTLAVDGATLREALPAGQAELAGGTLVQSGYSLVEVTRRIEGPTRLAGRFFPPQGAAEGQSYSLLVERAGEEPAQVFEWRSGALAALRGRRSLDALLGSEPGLVRLRFLARGTGAAARWEDLQLLAASAPAEAPQPPPPPPAPRLVLVYVMDALRADHLGHLGGRPDGSPTLDGLAAAGVVLADHLSLAPNTLPSVKTLFTGRPYLDDGMDDLPPAGEGPPVLAELFARAGYETGLFTGNGYVYYQARRGFAHAEESVLYEKHSGAAYNDNAERVHAAALRWLDGLPPDARVFLYLHTVHPHNPYLPPPAIERRFTAGIDSGIAGDTETLVSIKRARLPAGEADRARIRGLYQGGVAYNDGELAGFLAELVRRAPAPQLLAVFTADHGEELFDHGGLLHGYTLYGEQLRVPLTLWWPGRLAARRIAAPTDHLDLHFTLRQLVEPEAAPPAGARSLWSLVAGDGGTAGERLRFASASGVPGGIFSVQDRRFKLVWAPRQGAGWGQGEGLGRGRDAVALFDLESDPGETQNLAGRDSVEAAWLRSRLNAWIAQQRAAAAPAAPGSALTDEQRENLEALGYVQ